MLTSEKLIIRTKKTIDFISLANIQTVTIIRRASDRWFKLNTADIHILTKQGPRPLFTKMLPFYILNSVENPERVEEMILKARSYL